MKYLYNIRCLHNPEVPGSNLVLATWKSRTYVKSWVLCCFCVRFYFLIELFLCKLKKHI